MLRHLALLALLAAPALAFSEPVVVADVAWASDDASSGVCAATAAYHMGAILDTAEKNCEAIRQVEACATAGACGEWAEVTGSKAAFNPLTAKPRGKPDFRAYKI